MGHIYLFFNRQNNISLHFLPLVVSWRHLAINSTLGSSFMTRYYVFTENNSSHRLFFSHKQKNCRLNSLPGFFWLILIAYCTRSRAKKNLSLTQATNDVTGFFFSLIVLHQSVSNLSICFQMCQIQFIK